MKPSKRNIILTEDDLDDVLIFELAAKQLSIVVELRHAEDGEVLFLLLDQQIPDMIFLDIDVPCKNGFACLTEIRKDNRFDPIPVVMYTSHINEKYIDQCYSDGADLFLIKTGSIIELVESLKIIFGMDWGTIEKVTRAEFVLRQD